MNNKELLDRLSIRTIKDENNIYYSLILNFQTLDKLIIKLTDIFLTDGNEFNEFIDSLNNAENIKEFLITGTENFLPVENYLIPIQTANKYEIEDFDGIVNNVFNDDLSINSYWNLVDSGVVYYTNKNKSIEHIFSEDELNFLNSTFMNLIKDMSEFKQYSFDKNSVYKAVIDYYANGGYDSATILMNTIFNTEIKTTTSNITGCGCGNQSNCVNTTSNGTTQAINTGTTLVSLDNATCLEKYQAAMYQWLIDMLSNPDFYCCWMFMQLNNSEDIIPNDALLDMLISLLKEFLKLGYDLSNLKSNTNGGTCNCGHNKIYGDTNTGDCIDLLNNTELQCSNYSIILNYIKVLEWVKNNEIDENKNKIYIYGKQFAEIFPLLNF